MAQGLFKLYGSPLQGLQGIASTIDLVPESASPRMAGIELLSDHEIMELAMRDIVIIRKVLSMERAPEHLKDAGHLVLAYQHYLHKLRVEHNRARPWEGLPHSEVC